MRAIDAVKAQKTAPKERALNTREWRMQEWKMRD